MTWQSVRTVDYHTEGEPFRIVPEPPIDLPGMTVAERRARAASSDVANDLRTFLAFEPRGFDGMYGGFIVPPDDGGAHFGVLFWHHDGFSMACGHGSIALAVWAVDHGVVAPDPSGCTDVVIDVPVGRIRVSVHHREGDLLGAVYNGRPTRVLEVGRTVPTVHGDLVIDTTESGHNMLAISLAQTSLQVTRADLSTLIRVFADVQQLIRDEDWPTGGAGIAVFYRRLSVLDGDIHQRGVAIYGQGQVDRSPCGTGTAALVSLLHLTGQLPPGGRLIEESLLGARFVGTIADAEVSPGRVAPRVEGRAYPAGEHHFLRSAQDPFPRGFTLAES